jgi:alkylation response protein AidB-like acyl-CoA dehydrogenase
VLKILGSELGQAITTTTMDVLARHGLVYQTEALAADWNGLPAGVTGGSGMVRAHLHERASTIYGGTNEVQRNIIAKAMLGL